MSAAITPAWIFGPESAVIYGHVYGWRVFRVTTLRPYRLTPLFKSRLVWDEPGLLVADHRIGVGVSSTRLLSVHNINILYEAAHHEEAPVEQCLCGLHSYATYQHLRAQREAIRVLSTSSMHASMVIAMVRLEGPVIFHETGSRVRYQRIERLFVNKPSSTRQTQWFDHLVTDLPHLADRWAWTHDIRRLGHQIWGQVDVSRISIDPSEL